MLCHAAADLEKQRERDRETLVQVHRSLLISQLGTKHGTTELKPVGGTNYCFSITTQTSLGSVDKKSPLSPKVNTTPNEPRRYLYDDVEIFSASFPTN